MMKLLRVSVRGKILGTIILVSTLVVLCGAYLLSDALRDSRGLGRYLEAHAERYQAMEQDIGQGEFAVVRVLASDPSLALALYNQEEAEVATVAGRLMDQLQGSLAPDLLVISDANGQTYGSAGLKQLDNSDWRGSRLYQDLRAGELVRAKPAIIGKGAYRVSGVPVKLQDRTVGVVLLGQKLDTWFKHVAKRSQNKELEKQHRIALVEDGEKVIASALPEAMYPALVGSIKKTDDVNDSDGTLPPLRLGEYVGY